MQLKIVLEGNPILREPCEAVKKVTPELVKLASDMCQTMILANGIGLSAPQVGRKVQLLVYDTSLVEKNGSTAIMFNPEILHGENACDSIEGCLSLPGKEIKVERFKKIKVKYLNIYNEIVIRELNGLSAVVVQHEIDHLHGIILSDYEE